MLASCCLDPPPALRITAAGTDTASEPRRPAAEMPATDGAATSRP